MCTLFNYSMDGYNDSRSGNILMISPSHRRQLAHFLVQSPEFENPSNPPPIHLDRVRKVNKAPPVSVRDILVQRELTHRLYIVQVARHP